MEDSELFAHMRKVADMAFDYASFDPGTRGPWLEDRRSSNVNPYYSQTEQGLFLEICGRMPGYIWTPWGKWNCWGASSGNWEEVSPALLARLGAITHIPQRRTEMGEFGPVFAITIVEEVRLPQPVERKRGKYVEYNEAKRVWARLKQEWEASQRALVT